MKKLAWLNMLFRTNSILQLCVFAVLLPTPATANARGQRLTTKSALKVISEVHDRVHRYYVDQVDSIALIQGAVRGLRSVVAKLEGSTANDQSILAMASAWSRGANNNRESTSGQLALRMFERTFRQARLDHMSQLPVDSLARGAIDGMLSTLDPHSTYLAPLENESMQERFRGDFEGIGIYFEIRQGRLLVISPLVGSPSYGKLRAGDHIASIENRSTEGITTDQVIERLRGPKGSRVRVGVQRPGLEKLFRLTIQRDRIQLSSVPYVFLVCDGVGYIRIIQFTESTGDEVQSALDFLSEQGMNALVLDLRGNGGGLLSQAVDVADYFVDYGDLIVYTKGRNPQSRRDYRACRARTSTPLPLVVLIDEGSASAAEILAGAIQDLDLGIVAGQTSFGKGLVQEQFPIYSNGGLLLLTVARYYTPAGRLIQRPFSEDFEVYYREGGTNRMGQYQEYRTEFGRSVFSSGGITPDVVLLDSSFTAQEQEVLRSGALFDFGSKWVSSRDDWPEDFRDFLHAFQVSDEAIVALFDLLRQREATFSDEERTHLTPWLQQQLKSEFARVLWGDEEYYRISIDGDEQIRQSLRLIGEAKHLVQRRWH